MAQKFSQLIDKMPAPAVKRAQAKAQEMLADLMHVQQPSIAKIEKRADMNISTLRVHIEAMGGELEVVARFTDGNVKISNFSDIAGPATS
jgi:hypothetical protein